VRPRTEPGNIALMGTFPPGFFEPTHDTRPDDPGLDGAATDSLRDFYDDLGINGRVLDLAMPSGEHFHDPPDELTPQLLGGDPLPYADGDFDDALCHEGLAPLTHPLEGFAEVARVLKPGGRFICTFTSRRRSVAPVKGWAATDDAGRVRIARRYFELTPAFGPPASDLRASLTGTGDRLWAVWATRRPGAA
jgi:SAM-dependent methyltransferase